MGHPWRWFDGSRDPVDGARRNVEPLQERDPRELDFNLDEPVVSVEYEITIVNPLQVLIDCQELDEAAGVPPGTHFNEYCRRIAKPTS